MGAAVRSAIKGRVPYAIIQGLVFTFAFVALLDPSSFRPDLPSNSDAHGALGMSFLALGVLGVMWLRVWTSVRYPSVTSRHRRAQWLARIFVVVVSPLPFMAIVLVLGWQSSTADIAALFLDVCVMLANAIVLTLAAL